MRLPRGLTITFAILILALILGVGFIVTRPTGAVLAQASVGSARISPNADNDQDVISIHYRIRREAKVSIYLEDANGEKYYFRREETRSAGAYDVLFSGIVEPYDNADELVKGKVLQRLVPNGQYTWVIEALDNFGRTDSETGSLEVVDADTTLPDLWEFSVGPTIFTPNQDGIDDRVFINVVTPKPARLVVYLIDEKGAKIYIPESQGGRTPGDEGRHTFEYDGGIDNGSDPPPDGKYQVLVQSEDAEGQRIEATSQLDIQRGGVPLAEILGQPVGDTVEFSAETIVVGDVLWFELTVENYGDAPIRTTGPESGYIYDQENTFNSTGSHEESGAWRIGINCDNCLSDYPWRWALGTYDELTPITTNGQVHYYLMPGQRVVVKGGIRLNNIVASRNPQQFWAGLIHEDVGIAPTNNHVDPHWIEIVQSQSDGQ